MLLVCCCIQEVHQQNPDNPQETIRAHIYKKIGVNLREWKRVYIQV